MPIDASLVVWDEEPVKTGIDPNQVQWDDTPITTLPAVRATVAPEDVPWTPTERPQSAEYMLGRLRQTRPDLQGETDERLLSEIRKNVYPSIDPVTFYRQVGGDWAARYGDTGDPNPTEGMGGGQRFLAGVGQSLASTGRGIKQAATDAARYAVEANPVIFGERGGAAGEYLRGSLAQQAASVDEARRLEAPLLGTGAGMAGSVTGTVGQIVGPGMALKGAAAVPQIARAAPALDAAGSALLPTSVTGAAGSGAALGAIQPVGSEGPTRAQNVGLGATLGAAGAGIPRALTGAANIGRRMMPAATANLQERAAAEALETFSQDPAAMRAALTSARREIVPGSQPTTAELTGDIGLGGLQRTLANTPEFGNELALLREANQRARVAAIEGNFGGASKSAEEAATAIRNLEARQTLRPIGGIAVGDTSPVLNATNRLIEKNRASPTVTRVLENVRSMVPEIKTVQDAHLVRKEIDAIMSGNLEGMANGKLAKKELMTIKSVLDRQMREAYPDWGKFLRDYRAASKGIDQIKVGRNLLGRATATAVDAATPNLSSAQFSRAANDADAVVQQATRFRGARAENTLTPKQVEVMSQVAEDLQRYARTQERGRAFGSNTMQNIVGGNRVQDTIGPVGAAMIEPVSGAGLLFLNAARKNYGEKVAVILNDAMLNPDRAAEILAKLPPKSVRALTRQIAPFLNQAGSVTGRSSPALIQE